MEAGARVEEVRKAVEAVKVEAAVRRAAVVVDRVAAAVAVQVVQGVVRVVVAVGRRAAVEAVNAAPEYMIGKKLVAEGKKIAAETLADTSIPMKQMV